MLTHEDPATDLAAYEQDWRRRQRGRALAVVRPGSTEEVAAVVRACAAAGVSIKAAGRQHRTGGRQRARCQRHPGAAEPAAHEPGARARRANLTLTVDAGCILRPRSRQQRPLACCCR